MATRCDCRWEIVELHVDLDPLLLRSTQQEGCPAHPVRRVGEVAAERD